MGGRPASARAGLRGSRCPTPQGTVRIGAWVSTRRVGGHAARHVLAVAATTMLRMHYASPPPLCFSHGASFPSTLPLSLMPALRLSPICPPSLSRMCSLARSLGPVHLDLVVAACRVHEVDRCSDRQHHTVVLCSRTPTPRITMPCHATMQATANQQHLCARSENTCDSDRPEQRRGAG